jgi:hypothetical protein
MEVGIEDCLHIEFEYDKSKYVTHAHTDTNLHTQKKEEKCGVWGA